jgi:hypothetical protein
MKIIGVRDPEFPWRSNTNLTYPMASRRVVS